MTKFHGFKIMLVLFLAGIVAVVTIGIGKCNRAVNEVEKDVAGRKALIGRRIVIDKDTLTITDYSMWSENYTISNGTKVDYELVKKKVLPANQ